MESPRPVFIPQAMTWFLRIAANPALAEVLRTDSLAFAGWYAQVGALLEWPEEVQEIQKVERSKKLGLEKALKLLKGYNYALAGRTTVVHAKRVIEGYAIHDNWVGANVQILSKLSAERASIMNSLNSADMLQMVAGEGGSFSARMLELGKILKLSTLEQDILAFAFLTTISDEIAGLFRQLNADRWSGDRLWTVVFDTTKEELAKALRPKSPLRLSGLLRSTDRNTQLVRVSSFWIDLLVEASDLFETILEPYVLQPSSGMPARLQEEDQILAGQILKNAKEPGVNLLLYGAGSLEKSRLVREICKSSGLTPYRVRKFEDAGRQEWPCLTHLAFQLLKGKKRETLLVVDRVGQTLQSMPSEFIRQLFGVELEVDETSDFDTNLLKNNPVPGLWLASDATTLLESTVAQFVFHAPLKKADKATRLAALEEQLADIKLSDPARAEILKLEGVSSAQINSALRAARLAGKDSDNERDHAIVQAVRRSQRALSRDMQPKAKESVTEYSLKYLNTSGRFKPEQILSSLKKNAKGSLLLYGIPGTGKTQFVEHMAEELGMPLLTKPASELMSKWLGESEKNIAAAFEEAANSDSILFLDEADSFLRDRAGAHNSWEVTQVNELLQRIERYTGIVVAATNLFEGLDSAAMRRFVFKLEFLALDYQQRWDMFLSETGLKSDEVLDAETKEQWQHQLILMPDLASGDFATVKRQCSLLDMQLSPQDWLLQLELECKLKRREREGSQNLA